MASDRSLAVYVHIPFCVSKCNYCDFNSYANQFSAQSDYFAALNTETNKYLPDFKARGIGSIFFGGGTPTSVDTKYLVSALSNLMPYLASANSEISIECNPGTIDLAGLQALRSAGFNRLSLGLQSADDTELAALGRIHLFAQFREAFACARAAGFENINVDLMFGILGQSLKSWESTLANVAALRPEHVSAYGLKVEEGTPFWELECAGRLSLPSDSQERQMYRAAISCLAQAGYEHYEISNFALPGLECKHNLVYWKCGEYVGIGAGAHSYFDGRRFGNMLGIAEYVGASPECVDASEVCEIEHAEQMREFMMLGMRLIGGVSEAEFLERFGVGMKDTFGAELTQLVAKGLIEWDGREGAFRLTRNGLDFANQVFIEFV